MTKLTRSRQVRHKLDRQKKVIHKFETTQWLRLERQRSAIKQIRSCNNSVFVPILFHKISHSSQRKSLLLAGLLELGLLGGIGLDLLLDNSVADEAGIVAQGLEHTNGVGGCLLWGDGTGLGLAGLGECWHDLAANLLDNGVGSGGWDPSLGGLLGVLWEDNQLGLVVAETLDVGLLALNGLVTATVVDSNSERLGLLLAEADSLQKPNVSRAALGLLPRGLPTFSKRVAGTAIAGTATAFAVSGEEGFTLISARVNPRPERTLEL